MIIDHEGKIVDHKSSSQFKKEYNCLWLKDIAKKVSIRFKIKEFHKEMEGLQLTINVFAKYAMIVRSLGEDNIIVMIVPSTQTSIPTWIRKNAQWWADDLLFEEEFVKGIETR